MKPLKYLVLCILFTLPVLAGGESVSIKRARSSNGKYRYFAAVYTGSVKGATYKFLWYYFDGKIYRRTATATSKGGTLTVDLCSGVRALKDYLLVVTRGDKEVSKQVRGTKCQPFFQPEKK